MLVGTAGHIDHGKTTLVRALTGVDTDRLKEEKQRGISIELGYAYVPLADGTMLGFVDVPGHERLVHTMVAGASGIDFALLVVAADDGVMAQTREHLAIIELLGIARGAVAVTKADRVDAQRLAEVHREIDALLAAGTLRSAPRFALDARRDDDTGVTALRAHLHAAAAAQTRRSAQGLFRLAVDRVFTLPGHGTIAAGTVHAGEVRVGDTVQIMPAGLSARVRALHANQRDSEVGRAGQRCALNLAGVEKSAIARGNWLADARALLPSQRIDVRLRLLQEVAAITRWTPLHVHLGAAHRIAHVVPLEGDALHAGATARAQLVFDAPICASAGDRLIVRNAQGAQTIGGGTVIDPDAPARRRRSVERVRRLDAIEAALGGAGIQALLDAAAHGVALVELERLLGLPAHALPIPSGAALIDTADGARAIMDTHWRLLGEQAVAALQAHHAQAADDAGIEPSRLRRLVAPTLPEPVWRARVAASIATGELLRSGPWLHLPGHRVTMSAEETQLAAELGPVLAAGGFDPPWVRDLAKAKAAPEVRVRQTLRKMANGGSVYQVVPDLFYAAAQVGELARIVATLANADGEVSAGAFRDRIGLGRKRAVQILEFFDRVGYTLRVRNAHRLRGASAGALFAADEAVDATGKAFASGDAAGLQTRLGAPVASG